MKKTLILIALIFATIISVRADAVFVLAHDENFTTYYAGRGFQVWEYTNEFNPPTTYIQTIFAGNIGNSGLVWQAPNYDTEPRCFSVWISEKNLGAGRWVITKWNPDLETFEFFGYDKTFDCFEENEPRPDRIYDATWVLD